MDKELLRKIITKDKEAISSISFHMKGDSESYYYFTNQNGPIYNKITFEDDVVSIYVNNVENHIVISNINAIKIWRKEK